MMNLIGKRFLITHSIFQGFMGSSIVALELAQYLKKTGAEVLVYTNFVGEPLKKSLTDEGINYVTSDQHPELSLKDFDYVWVQSQVLPQSLIRELTEITLSSPMPVFLFNHMNKNKDASDERPFIWGLEESLSSLSLFVSEECRDELRECFSDGTKLGLFCNPAPVDYSISGKLLSDNLTKILVVSNHVPEEVFGAKELLENKGCKVDVLGGTDSGGSTKRVLVTAELLAKYDVVITIGKTVQYCLTSGIPVYIYDWFGGDGYLNSSNFEAAAYANFSGRESLKRKTAEEIAEEVISNYSSARDYFLENRSKFIERYSIDSVFNNLLKSITPLPIKKFEVRYAEALIDTQEFSNRHWRLWGWAHDEEVQIANIEKKVMEQQMHIEESELELQNQELAGKYEYLLFLNQETEASLRNLEIDNKALETELTRMNNTVAFKLGHALLTPAYWIYDLIKGKK